jgi:hypothetical protein
MESPVRIPSRTHSTLSTLRRLLLLPLLAPLLALLLLAAFNPRPRLSLRLLTLNSPSLPLGVWLAAGGVAGAALSALATALALQQGGQAARPREPGAGPRERQEPWSVPGWGGWGAERRSAPAPEAMADVAASAGPPRAPGEPPPTVSVPFRVIRRPARPERKPQATSSVDRAPQAASGEATPGGGDDWDSHEEDW